MCQCVRDSVWECVGQCVTVWQCVCVRVWQCDNACVCVCDRIGTMCQCVRDSVWQCDNDLRGTVCDSVWDNVSMRVWQCVNNVNREEQGLARLNPQKLRIVACKRQSQGSSTQENCFSQIQDYSFWKKPIFLVFKIVVLEIFELSWNSKTSILPLTRALTSSCRNRQTQPVPAINPAASKIPV